jgi:quercetin dioxygenase-like cupin family protein
VNTPYVDTVSGAQHFTRTFAANLSDAELVWHRDRNKRKILVVSGAGWRFQHDNQLPKKLEPGDVFVVEQSQFHRLIKGHTDLILEITEYSKQE